jgi:hypothetical protein
MGYSIVSTTFLFSHINENSHIKAYGMNDIKEKVQLAIVPVAT